MNSEDQREESFSIGRIDTDFTYDEKMVHEFFFVTDSSTQIMRRRYQNLQDLLAILGGISSTYLIVANFFLANYKKFLIITNVPKNLKIDAQFQQQTEKDVLNEKNKKVKSYSIKSKKSKKNIFKEEKLEANTYHFPFSSFRTLEKPKPPQQKVINSMEIIDHNKIDTKIDINEIKSQRNIKSSRYIFNEKNIHMSPKFRKSLNSAKTKLRQSKPSLKFGYFSFLRYQIKKNLSFSLNKDEELLDSGVQTYSSEMDVLNILQRLKEITKLKSILLVDSIPSTFAH